MQGGAYNLKGHGEMFSYILSTFDKHGKMQLLAKFKKNSVGGVRSLLPEASIRFAFLSQPCPVSFYF